MRLKYSNFSKIRAKKAIIHNNLKIPALSLACNHHSWISCGIGQTSGAFNNFFESVTVWYKE